jgi:hypothetical protein
MRLKAAFGFLLVGLVVGTPAVVSAQAPKIISHQGRLTDNLGDPVSDGSRNMTFRLYGTSAGGSALWEETRSVATTNGFFAVELGSVSSFDGFNFNRPLWLSVQIGADDELAPRNPVTSVPSAVGLVHPYKAVVDTFLAGFWIENEGSGDAILAHNRGSGTAGAFIVSDPTEASVASGVFAQNNAKGPAVFGQHIGVGGEAGRFQITNPSNTAPALLISNEGSGPGLYASSNAVFETADLSPTGAEGANEDISIYASDAQIGLYSNVGGVAGSGFQLGEMDSGSLMNKWSIYRQTTSAGGNLRFTYGTDPSYGVNAVMLEFSPSGDMSAGRDVVATRDFKYSAPKTRTLHLPAAAFHLANVADAWRELNGYITCWSESCTETFRFTSTLELPDDAEVKSFTAYYYDGASLYDLEVDFTLKRRALLSSGTQTMGSSPATTSGSSTSIQSKTIDTSSNINRVIDNDNYMYWAEVDVDYLGDAFGAPSGLRRFYGMTIEYESDRP